MSTIKQLSDIDYDASPMVDFDATVIKINSEGDGEKKPIRMILKLEGSGENTEISSWKFSLLPDWKRMVLTDEVGHFTGKAGQYPSYGQRIRVNEMILTGQHSVKKHVKSLDVEDIKHEISTIIDSYIKNQNLHKYLSDLIMNNEKFWKWPAATKVHHNYPGGLAKHSMNVCRNAINTWRNYNSNNCDVEIVVTAALLHDIGKIREYKEDGSRTVYGDLIGHPVIGYQMLWDEARKCGVDPETDMKTVIVGHIILSHHGSLEFGSPVQPGVLEAWIVHEADKLDAEFEACDAELNNMEINMESDRLMAIDGAKLFKWHN